MASGVKVADECISAYQEIKLGHKWRYVIYRLSDDLRTVIVQERAGKNKSYNDFVETLHEAEQMKQCRYAVYDVEYMHNDMQRSKLAFFLWSPETATIKQKMVYTSTKDALKQKLVGLGVEIQSTDDTELALTYILEKCKDKSF
ncbi:actophorin-like [Liolophura sinensis]|uniref:actophorin-like n=1 Tax=Liolophura sinensis TaxID=3198878 RepID=UPI0031580B21